MTAARARLSNKGTVAVEYGLLAPVFLLLVLGLIDVSRLMWTQVTLEHAVEAAARCAAVNVTLCGTAGQVQAYAATQAYGMTVSPSAFTPSAPACGARVAASLPVTLITPWIGSPAVTLTASACEPVQTS